MRFIKFVAVVVFVCFLFGLGGLWADLNALEDCIYLLNISCDSIKFVDDRLDNRLKDTVTAHVEDRDIGTGSEKYIEDLSTVIKKTADDALKDLGIALQTNIHFNEEIIEAGRYGTVFLPTGIYKAIHIDIGDGDGQLRTVVIYQGNSKIESGVLNEKRLQEMICPDGKRQVRLFLLECMGRIEKIMVWNG